MFTERCLPKKNVKQIGIEYQSPDCDINGDNYLRIISTLEGIGFRKWNVHWNMNFLKMTSNNISVTRCNEF
ncbi:hypothetical protein LSH36_677g00004 [Paralvinella palmiformis]|uniref:Uncharacterized protein n=1 Tax=Paralvinella palmiformis TaxID=53620 RepID=A0AAD9MWE9_9ANNE|nr:hypothetical protein LSH36_677g00004 [Paralvinella palmiformis]